MAKIFVQDTTLLDCAFFLPEKGPCGRSYTVDVAWSGELDSQGMLFDFALAKRSAKQTIDLEFDHKLLVKSTQIRQQSHNQVIIADYFETDPRTNHDGCSNDDKKNSFFALNTYPAAIKKISRETLKALENEDVTLLEKDIANDVLRNSPPNIKEVQVKLRQPENYKQPNCFSYTHSLCYHVGNCQRFHGHSSLVEVFKNKAFDAEKSRKLAQLLQGKYIISRNYLKQDWSTKILQDIVENCPEIEDIQNNLCAVQYQGTQGQIGLILPKEKVIALDYESTVENLAYFIAQQHGELNSIEIRAYEGLCKGAIYP